MRVTRIFTTSAIEVGHTVELDAKASHHLSKVLRIKLNNSLILFNGDGYQYYANVEALNKKSVTVSIVRRDNTVTESPLNIHLGIAISKGDRMDWVVQKATELGVSEITPLLSERTEIKLKGERLKKKINHWQQVAISACEQCGRNKLPIVHPIQTLSDWIAISNVDKKWVLHHRTEEKLDATQSVNSAALLIGPEGGLSETEIKTALEHQFSALQLGPRVLRTETAPLAAIAIIQHMWGDL